MKMQTTTRFYGALALVGLVIASCSSSDAASDGPTSDVPNTDVSATDVSTSDVSTSDAPTTEAPTSDAPTTDSPTTDGATTDAPTSEAPTSDAPVDGFLFESADGDYSLVFPQEPTLTVVPVPLPTGEVQMDLYAFDAGSSAYFTSVIDYPPAAVPADDPQVVLTNARDGAIENVGGELRDSEFVETSGVSGIRFTFDVDSEGIVGDGVAIFYYSEPRLYQTFGLGDSGKTDSFETFVDSFTFTGVMGTES